MGRPREHGEETRVALLAAAERLVAESGPDALSVRAVAEEIGTTTRAVYTVFGSKDGLVSALAQRAFEILVSELSERPPSGDPAEDLIDAGAGIFRTFVREHPSLFRIAFQRVVPGLQPAPGLIRARERALQLLTARVQRIADAGQLNGRSVREATVTFNAMCEGLANAELRGATLPILPSSKEETAWREALKTVVGGFASKPGRPARKVRSGRRAHETRQRRTP